MYLGCEYAREKDYCAEKNKMRKKLRKKTREWKIYGPQPIAIAQNEMGPYLCTHIWTRLQKRKRNIRKQSASREMRRNGTTRHYFFYFLFLHHHQIILFSFYPFELFRFREFMSERIKFNHWIKYYIAIYHAKHKLTHVHIINPNSQSRKSCDEEEKKLIK